MTEQESIAAELRKIANLLAVREVRNLKKGEGALILSLSGFSNKEIAALIGTSEGSVRGLLSAARKRPTANGE
jgi:DNA-directed RNA polymerase specialized sigma24 family protein